MCAQALRRSNLKRLLALAVLFLACVSVQAQQKLALSAQSTDCTVAGSCLSVPLVITGPTRTNIALGSATITVSANASANTLQFEACSSVSSDCSANVGWYSITSTQASSGTQGSSTTSTGWWQFNVGAFTNVRVRCSTFVSGTATVTITTSPVSARAGGGGGVTVGAAGTIVGGTGGGTAQAQTLTPSPAITSYVTGGSVIYCVMPIAANTAAAPTFNVSSLGARNVVSRDGVTALVANDIITSVAACMTYDGTNFDLLNPQAKLIASSVLQTGSGASSAGATAAGGFACVESASTGWTPTAGQDYIRCDSTLHAPVQSLNGSAEFQLLGNADFTFASHTLTGSAASVLNDSGGSILQIPYNSTGDTVNGQVRVNSANGNFTWFDGAAQTNAVSLGPTGATLDCSGTQQYLIRVAGDAVPLCGSLAASNARTSQKNETTTADANVLTLTPAAAAGTYRACVVISVSAATSGVISWTLSWTDSNGNAQSNIAQDLFQQGTAAPNTTFTTSAAGNYNGCTAFDINNAAANIVVKWVGGGTTTAKMSATIERLI